jgi:hypothetical protein
MSRRHRRGQVPPADPSRTRYEEPWWKWAGVPNLTGSRPPRHQRRALLKGALIGSAIVATVFTIMGILWTVIRWATPP